MQTDAPGVVRGLINELLINCSNKAAHALSQALRKNTPIIVKCAHATSISPTLWLLSGGQPKPRPTKRGKGG